MEKSTASRSTRPSRTNPPAQEVCPWQQCISYDPGESEASNAFVRTMDTTTRKSLGIQPSLLPVRTADLSRRISAAAGKAHDNSLIASELKEGDPLSLGSPSSDSKEIQRFWAPAGKFLAASKENHQLGYHQLEKSWWP